MRRPGRPFKNIAVSYVQDMNISGSFSARVSGLKPIPSLSWDMQRNKKNAEVPVLLREAAMATDNYLVSELQKRGIQVFMSQTPESQAVLQIKPIQFLVG